MLEPVSTSSVQAKDDSTVLSAKFTGSQRQSHNISQHLRFNQSLPNLNTIGFENADEREKNVEDSSSSSCNANAFSGESGCKNISLCSSTNVQQIAKSERSCPLGVVSNVRNVNFLSKLSETPSKVEKEPCSLSLRSSSGSLASSSDYNILTSATSVTTDLGLGINSTSISWELEKPQYHTQKNLQCNISGNFKDGVTGSMSDCLSQPSSPFPDFDQRNFKMFYTALSKKIGRQERAATVISQTITQCRGSNDKQHVSSRGDIWFHFSGPDRSCKKKIAIALAELLYGSRENFVCVNLCFQERVMYANNTFGHRNMNGYKAEFRGRTVVDYIVGELTRKPLSVILLENIDEADPLAQNSLSRAVKTGWFADSFGREVSICNAIFITTSRFVEGRRIHSSTKTMKFLEENILKAKGCPIQISIGFHLGEKPLSHNNWISLNSKKCDSDMVFMNKRKLNGSTKTTVQHESSEIAKRAHKALNLHLDLNLPAEESEICDTENGNCDYNSVSEKSKEWLGDFLGQVNETVVFQSFDYDALGEKLLEEMRECLYKIVGLECLLEVDQSIMEQILAASCLSDDDKVEHWFQQVLRRGFIEANERHNLTAQSVVRLSIHEDLLSEGQASEALLPSRIIVN